MWFADIGVVLGWVALICWVVLVALAFLLPRSGRTTAALLLTAPTRLPLLIGTGAAALLFAAQAGVVDTVADRTGAGLVDQAVWSWFVTHRVPAMTRVMTAVTSIGNTVAMALLALTGAAVLWRTRQRAAATLVVAATIGSSLLITGFKNLYSRARPPVAQRLTLETNAALPSGHSLGSMVVLGMLAAVVVILVRRPAVRILAVLAAAGGIPIIGISRLYLGVHWTTDVLTGWLLGGAWLAMCTTALVLLRHHRSEPWRDETHSAIARGLPADGVAR